MNAQRKGIVRPRHSAVPLSRLLLSLPAAIGLTAGVILILALMSASRTTTGRDLEKRAVLEGEQNNLPAAAIDYRRLLQQFPENAQFRSALAHTTDAAKHSAQ